MNRKEQIVDVARQLLEAGGPDAVTMQAIAAKLEIKAPSLYKHIINKHELEVALIARGFVEQAEAFTTAIHGTNHPITAIGNAYRAWAVANPHLYALMTTKPLPRDDLPDGIENAAAKPLLDAVDGDTDRARILWAFAHGMVSLELAKRFPSDADVDKAWSMGLDSFEN